MMKTTKAMLGTVAVVLAAGSAAEAQSVTAPKQFITFNVAAQPQRRDLASSSTFTIYQEDASINSTNHVSNGAYFDIGGGYRVWHEMTVGASFSYFQSTGTGQMTAVIPSPLVFGQNRTVTVDADALKRKEVGLHIKASWYFPVNDKIDVALSIGPSIAQVSQDLVTASAADVTPGTGAPGTQNITAQFVSEKKTGIGVNASFDGTYMVNKMIGVGILLQYAGGKVDLDSVTDVAWGGFQGGVGIRIRF